MRTTDTTSDIQGDSVQGGPHTGPDGMATAFDLSGAVATRDGDDVVITLLDGQRIVIDGMISQTQDAGTPDLDIAVNGTPLPVDWIISQLEALALDAAIETAAGPDWVDLDFVTREGLPLYEDPFSEGPDGLERDFPSGGFDGPGGGAFGVDPLDLVLGIAGATSPTDGATPRLGGLIFGLENADAEVDNLLAVAFNEINGTNKNDILIGTDAADSLAGDNGNDLIFGRDAGDLIDGGRGNDTLFGGKGDDSLDGGKNNDRLFGAEGADDLAGGAGRDTLDGGDGDDLLNGGAATTACSAATTSSTAAPAATH